MPKPRASIYARILLATLTPLVLIFIASLVIINYVVFSVNNRLAVERTRMAAEQIQSGAASIFHNIRTHMDYAALNLLSTLRRPEADDDFAIAVTRNGVTADTEAQCAWVVIEPGTYGIEGRRGYSFVRSKVDDSISDVRILQNENFLDDPIRTPWYHIPRRTGQPFYFTVAQYDYHDGDGNRYLGELAVPVFDGDRLAFVYGVDILYEELFDFLVKWEESSDQRILLLAEDGLILYSSDPSDMHRNISDLDFTGEAVYRMMDALLEKRDVLFEGVSPFTKAPSLSHLMPMHFETADRVLYVYTEVPLEFAYREGRRALYLVLVVGVLGLILVGVSVSLTSRTIIRPIQRLTATARWIASGNLDAVRDGYEPPENPRHEVDVLEASIMTMVDRVLHGKELGILAIETQFEQEKAEQAAAAKERFLASVSHEIRTPLNAIIGFSELLATERLGVRPAKFARDIRSSAESLAAILGDVLDFSKLESGELPLLEVHYDVHALLEHVNSVSNAMARSKALSFEMDISPDLPRYLFGDDIRVRQILLQLVGNAVKFTRSGEIRVDVYEDGQDVHVDVHDTGVGIAESDLPRLFNPFEQLDDTGVKRHSGSGLGLSISRNLARLMGGDITVESTLGKGSVFHFIVPMVLGDVDQVESTGSGDNLRFSQDASILVVDDSPINLDVAEGLISLFDIRVDKVKSGKEALKKIQESEYDIVFMDHMMPGMDGIECAQRIRSLGGRFERQVIIALTANAVIGTKELFLEAGMNDFLSKPIMKTRLHTILAKWMPTSKRIDMTSSRRGTIRNTVIRLNPNLPSGHSTRFFIGKAESGRFRSPSSRSTRAIAGRRLEAARAVAGLDVSAGLRNMAGDHDLYLKILAMMPPMRESLPKNLESFIESGDLARFRVEIHGAKGSLANLGAEVLSRDAAVLENAAAQGDAERVRSMLPYFISRFTEFCRDLEKALATL